MATRIEDIDGLGKSLIVEKNDGGMHVIPLETLAAVSELLGEDDLGKVVSYLDQIRAEGEPPPDPVTGENAWSEAYKALHKRGEWAAKAMRNDPALLWEEAVTLVSQSEEGQALIEMGNSLVRRFLGLPGLDDWVPKWVQDFLSGQTDVKKVLAGEVNTLAKMRAEFQELFRPEEGDK